MWLATWKFPLLNQRKSLLQKHSDGSATHSLFLITDLDHDSKSTEKKNTWFSLGLKASLTVGKVEYEVPVIS